MKQKLTIIMAAVTLFAAGAQSLADNSVDRLISKMTQEREQVLTKVIDGWKSGEAPEKLRKLVLRLVDVHVRLAAIDRDANRDFAGRVIGNVQVNPEEQNAYALAGSVAQAYYAEKGLDVKTRARFANVYHIWTTRN